MAAEMDPKTQAHIEAAQRPPVKREPRRLSGETVGEEAHHRALSLPEREAELKREREAAGLVSSISPVPVDGAELPPARDYIAEREKRDRERVVRKLDRIAPATLTQLDEGPRLKIKVPCSGCGQNVDLVAGPEDEIGPLDAAMLNPEAPGVLRARMLAAGWLRTAPVEPGGRFSGVMCDGCFSRVEKEERERNAGTERSVRLSDSCLPRAMQGFRFEEMRPSGYSEDDRVKAIDAARRWASVERVDSTPGLLLFGTKGAGKSRLAATALMQRLDHWSGRWVSWPALAGQLLGAFNDEDRKVAMSVLNGTQALVLDDIARDDLKVGDWEKGKLFVAIDKRVQAGSPILITTNLTGTAAEPNNPLAAIAERLGGSIASRLAGYCRIVELPGDDMRLVFDYEGRQKGRKLSPAEEQAAKEGLRDPEMEA